jgi:hypothetical protein
LRIDTETVLRDGGYLAFPAERVVQCIGSVVNKHASSINSSFQRLVRDDQMGDGGRYRFRRFSRFNAIRCDGAVRLTASEDHSILQSREDNPLNGGILRTFQPLEPEVCKNPLLLALIKHDIDMVESLEPDLFAEPVSVGVHQVRITALGQTPGKPTPEGIHRDAERYTFQHFWNRSGISGGEFLAYDENKNQVFRWLQTEMLDSILFTGTTWHSATPISRLEGSERGFRDIFLVDFT